MAERVQREDEVGGAERPVRIEDAAVRVDLERVERPVAREPQIDASVARRTECGEHAGCGGTQLGVERGVRDRGLAHSLVVDPLEVEVLERLARRELDLDRHKGDRVAVRLRRVGHEHAELAPLDELLHERRSVGGRRPVDLARERTLVLDARITRHADARVALRVLDDQRRTQGLEDVRRLGAAAGGREGRGRNADRMAGELHRNARRVVGTGIRARVRETEPLERHWDLDAGDVLVPRPVAEVDVDVEPRPRRVDQLPHGRDLAQLQRRPVVLGQEPPRDRPAGRARRTARCPDGIAGLRCATSIPTERPWRLPGQAAEPLAQPVVEARPRQLRERAV